MDRDATTHGQAPGTPEPPAGRQIGRGLLELMVALPLFAFAPLMRRWHLRWGATDAELASPMADDDIVPAATFDSTRAITIAAPPKQVWPWIVQMGYRRASFYAYDLVDNAGYPSADRILAEYQTFAVGNRAFNMNGLFGDPPMAVRMLKGIKERAEHL